MDAAALIRRARSGAGFSLRHLAELAGTSHATLSAYEGDHVNPSMQTVQRIIRAAGFGLTIELVPLVGDFARKVLRRTARIPYGSVASYGEGALDVGTPRGARAVGNALGSNPIPVIVPCHRVVRTGGAIGGYGGGLPRKRLLLDLEAG